jgi:hypothetical protein
MSQQVKIGRVRSAIVVSPKILEHLLPAVASVLGLPPWIWLAVRTRDCLQIISAHTIPYPRRTIWLAKILALIVGAGGVLGVAVQLGIPWFLAILPATAVVFFALREHVQEIIPPKPNQDASAYRSSWQQYRHLRSDYVRSWKWVGGAGAALILLTAFADKLPNSIAVGLFALCVLAVLASSVVMNVKQFKWLRWPCPRCGCAFRGLWWRARMPKNCVYCGLPREGISTPVPAKSW